MSALAPAAPPPATLFDNSPTYQMACRQLDTVARAINLDPGIAQRLMVPKRSMIVAVPIRMDTGETRTFIGYRVQHSQTSGASKGGLRYAPSVDLGEVAALAMWMGWKCGIMNLPFSGAKGGIACDPAQLSLGEKERLTRRFTEEVLNIIGPRVDVMAPDMGTDEQTMAWIYDTYSMKVGYACPEIVTGKPVELGGCVGRREATGRGVVYCVTQALTELGLKPEGSTAVVQGYGNVGSVTCDELAKLGAKVVAIGDRYGAIRNERGIDVAKLGEYVAKNERQLVASAGSVIFMDAMVFHRAGVNRSAAARLAVNHVIGLPILSQQIDIPRSLGGKWSDDPLLSKYLGYRWNPKPSVVEWRRAKIEGAKG